MTKPVIPQFSLPVPTRNNPQNFSDRANVLVSELPEFVNKANEVADYVNEKTTGLQEASDSVEADRQAAEQAAESAAVDAQAVETKRQQVADNAAQVADDKTDVEADKNTAVQAKIDAEAARDQAEEVVTGGTASSTPEAAKIPLADSDGKIHIGWTKNFSTQVDADRAAANRRAQRPASGIVVTSGNLPAYTASGGELVVPEMVVDIYGYLHKVPAHNSPLQSPGPTTDPSGLQSIGFFETHLRAVTGPNGDGNVYENGCMFNTSQPWGDKTAAEQDAFAADPFNHITVADGVVYQRRLRSRAEINDVAGDFDSRGYEPWDSASSSQYFEFRNERHIRPQANSDVAGAVGSGGLVFLSPNHNDSVGDKTLYNSPNASADGGQTLALPIYRYSHAHDGTTNAAVSATAVHDLRIISGKPDLAAVHEQAKQDAIAGNLTGFGSRSVTGTHQTTNFNDSNYTNGVHNTSVSMVIFNGTMGALPQNRVEKIYAIGFTGRLYSLRYNNPSTLRATAIGHVGTIAKLKEDFEYPKEFKVIGLPKDKPKELTSSYTQPLLYGPPTDVQAHMEGVDYPVTDATVVTVDRAGRYVTVNDGSVDSGFIFSEAGDYTYAAATNSWVTTQTAPVERDPATVGWLNDPAYDDGDFYYVGVDVADGQTSMLPRDVLRLSGPNVETRFRVPTYVNAVSDLKNMVVDGESAVVASQVNFDSNTAINYAFFNGTQQIYMEASRIDDTSVFSVDAENIEANPLGLADVGEIVLRPNEVTATASFPVNYGALLHYWISGKVPTSALSSNSEGHLGSRVLESMTVLDGKLAVSVFGVRMLYTPWNNTNHGNRLVHAAALTKRNGRLFLQLHSKTLVRDAVSLDYGDSGAINAVNKVATTTDDNGNSVTQATHEIALPYYVGE